MEISDLRVFHAVASAGGITRAAALLHRVPSNVTTRIKKLEEELGVLLFTREGRRLQLSSQGRLLLDYASRLLLLADEARAAVKGSAPSGVLHLGAMESTAAIRLPSLLGRLFAQYPDLSVELGTGLPRLLAERVIAGELDAAFLAEPVSDARLSTVLAYVEPVVLIAPRGHPKIRHPRDVPNATLLVFEPDCPHRQRLEAWWGRERAAPRRVVELGSYHAILGCCAASMGIALVPASVLDTYSEKATLSVHKMSGGRATMKIYLAWRKGDFPPKVAALAELVRGAAQAAAR